MTQEPVVQDKIRLLMDETGCDQQQAELAMSSAGYDLEKAIRTIGALLKDIVVVKCKLHVPTKNLYGLMVVICDTKRNAFLRLRDVVSYNPAIYETALSEGWFDFEKRIYAFRLWEGTLQQMTQELERFLNQSLSAEVEEFCEHVRRGDAPWIQDSLARKARHFLSDGAAVIEILLEELDMAQYRHLRREEDSQPSGAGRYAEPPGESLRMNVQLVRDENGPRALEAAMGDSASVLITDERDIAQYLWGLLGGRNNEGLRALEGPIEEIRSDGENVFIQVRLSAGIVGLAQATKDARCKIQPGLRPGFWRRLMSFWE